MPANREGDIRVASSHVVNGLRLALARQWLAKRGKNCKSPSINLRRTKLAAPLSILAAQ
jgi:hypothetical protein